MVFVLSPLFALIRFVVFLPFTPVKAYNSNRIDFRFSKAVILSSLIQVVLVVYSLCSQSLQNDNDIKPGNISYTPTFHLTAFCIMHLMHCIPLPCIFLAKKKWQVFKEISDLALSLQRGTLNGKKRLLPYLTLIYVVYSLGSVAYLLQDEYFIKIMFFNEYLKFIFSCAILEFYEVVSDVKDLFSLVNSILPHSFEMFRGKKMLVLSRQSSTPAPHEVELDLRNVLEVHRQVCCAVESINSAYGCQNLLVVVLVFLHLIYSSLEFLSFPPFYYSWPIIPHAVNGMLMYLIVLYVLVSPCSHTTAEAKKTVAILSKLMEKTVEEDHFKKLEVYCRQLFMRNVEFSACGFFTLEIPLILSMLSIVTTYFTIIMQFHMTEVKKESSMSTEMTSPQVNLTMQP